MADLAFATLYWSGDNKVIHRRPTFHLPAFLSHVENIGVHSLQFHRNYIPSVAKGEKIVSRLALYSLQLQHIANYLYFFDNYIGPHHFLASLNFDFFYSNSDSLFHGSFLMTPLRSWPFHPRFIGSYAPQSDFPRP